MLESLSLKTIIYLQNTVLGQYKTITFCHGTGRPDAGIMDLGIVQCNVQPEYNKGSEGKKPGVTELPFMSNDAVYLRN